MKITLNLSPASSARDRYAFAWAIPAMLIGLATLIVLGRASLHEYRDYRDMQHQLAEVQYRADELLQEQAAIRKKLEDPAYRELLVRAKFINELIDQRVFSPTEVSARLAGLLPEDAHLTGLALSAPKKPGEDYAVRMGIAAKGEDAVETFINDLEDAPDFKDVTIINQGFQEEASQGPQVNLVCTARYLPGAEEASEEKSQESEALNPKPQVGSQVVGVKGQKPQGKAPEHKVANQKVGNSSAEKSTSDRKSNH
jgi:hypothetical protein